LGAVLRILLHPAFEAQGKSWTWLPILDGQEYLRRSVSGWKDIFAPSSPPLGSFLYPALLRTLGVEERGDLSVLFVFQNVCGLVSLLLLFVLMRRFARPWIAGALTALWSLVPIFAYWEHQVSGAAVAVLMALALALIVTSKKPNPVAAGFVAGLGAMLTPVWTWPLFLALAGATLWTGGRRRWLQAAGVAATFLVVSSPMLAAGLRAHMPPVLSWESGIDAYIGHAPGASGTFRRDAPLRWRGYTEFLAELNDSEGRQIAPAEAGRLWGARARGEAFSHPGRTLSLEMKKIALAFSPHESPQVRSPRYGLGTVFPAAGALLLLEWLLVPVGFAGLVIAARRQKALALLAAALLVPLVLRYVSSAGRLPLLALLAAGGAIFLEGLVTRTRRERLAAVALAAGALVLFGFAVRPPGIHDPSEEMRVASVLSNQSGNRPLAIDRSQQAVRLDPENIAARIHLASLLSADGVFPGAAEQLQAAVNADSTYVPALAGLAEMRQRLTDHASAVGLYRKVIEQRPKNPVYWNDLGGAYLQLSQMDSAMVCFSRALAIFPGYDTARQNLATVQGAIAANTALFEAVVPVGASTEEMAAFATALRAVNAGSPAVAERILETLPDAVAGDLRRPYLAGMIALHEGENRAAAQNLEQCYRAVPGNALIAFQLAQVERQIGRLDLAIEVLEGAIRLHPQEATLVQLLQQYRAETQ
jgi:tetratricopeptide (TPR) repeat protein